MKKNIRKIARLFLKAFFPRLYFIEKNDTVVGSLAKNVARSKVGSEVKIAGPCQIGNCEISDHSYIGSNSVISLTTIGKFCSIGPNLFCGYGVHPTNGLSTSPAFYSSNQSGISFSRENKIVENLPVCIG